jgi:hypothetical protein
MKIELTKSQISYLKSLDSKKKKRKFLLDCLIENTEVEIETKELIEKSNEVAKLLTDFCVKITDENREVLEKVSQKIRNKTCKLGDGFLQSNSLATYVCVSKTSKLYEDKRPSKIVTTDEFLKYIGREDLIERKSVKISELKELKPLGEFKANYNPEEIELVKHNINQREVTEQGSELLKFDMLEKEDKNLYSEMALLFLDKGFSSFLSLNDAIEIEKLVLKYNENAN